ncbi:hypothetical protein CoNPh26_CDS0083 [Staphylococcus phage S-CoN_Ph26]|nr:hypothetical protein CoNPh26_CDS0083 [Staphylococcus phage S-CoN_Ph26]
MIFLLKTTALYICFIYSEFSETIIKSLLL